MRLRTLSLCLVSSLILMATGNGDSHARSRLRKPAGAVRKAAPPPRLAYRSPARVNGRAARVRPRPRLAEGGLGFLAGINFGYGMADPSKEGSTRNALTVSAHWDIKIADGVFLTPELGFVPRGVRTTVFSTNTVLVPGDVRLDYLEVPLFVKWRVTLDPRSRLSLFTGPAAALAVAREVQVLGLVQLDLSNRFSSFDLTWHTGVGWDYQIKPGLWSLLQLRYYLGLTDIDTTEAVFHTRGIQILFGIRFPL